MKTLNKYADFIKENDIVTESVLTGGSYYFDKGSVDSGSIPTKNEVIFALIATNDVLVNNERMNLLDNDAKMTNKGFDAEVIYTATEEDLVSAEYSDLVKRGNSGNKLTIIYGTLKTKGSNVIFTEIDGTLKTLK